MWTRILSDTPLLSSPSDKAEVIGMMKRTYGAKVLDKGDEYLYIFSPDWNKNGYISRDTVTS